MDQQIELPAKDVFALLGVPVPENLETVAKSGQGQGDAKDDAANESQYSLDEDDKVPINLITERPTVDVTPPEEHSSSDDMTDTEIDDERFHDPNWTANLKKSDCDALKILLQAIKNSDHTKTVCALIKLKMNEIEDFAYQNMFIALNGFEVLINILESNSHRCIVNNNH
ncbi:Hypothetical protein CINCED_3A000543 [Cinara cedri]|uniref:Uncharacterized protein n=1 Tax=Cinara cedri TaxID=506608 RepID=A0A5E4MXY3_9HEMI|nr:Hypothetical protein CINCED_3A000543 [Cinara cedri]